MARFERAIRPTSPIAIARPRHTFGQLCCRAAEQDEQNEQHRRGLFGQQQAGTFCFTFIAAVRQLVSIEFDSNIFDRRFDAPLTDPQDLIDPADRVSPADTLANRQAGRTAAELAEFLIWPGTRRKPIQAEFLVLTS